MRPETSPDYHNNRLGKEVEEQFNISADLFYQAIENADGVPYQLNFGTVLGDGYFLNAGYRIKELFGVMPGEFTEKLFQTMIQEIIPLNEDIPHDLTEAREKITDGKIHKYKAEILVTTPGGEKKWIMDSSVPMTDDKTGKVTGMVGIFFDITEHKRILVMLEKALERATESDRLKTAFLNNLPHEIRTPLNAIVGFSTLLNEPGQLMENRLEFQDIITHSSDHLLEIVDDVVEISKIEAKIVRLIIKQTNLNQMLQRVYDRFKPAADEKNIILRYDALMDENEVMIFTDGYKLFQSLNNLLSNAVKFTFKGRIEFGYSIKENKIEFYVSDTGIGIGLEHQPNIFKPFYQAENSSTKRYEGTGLGLSIARAYIELLGGEIWFTTEPGEGSVFCFNIPDTR
ncbi:MAG: PAS domain-containing sensor histidine kinase [Bacteroidales bacterium]